MSSHENSVYAAARWLVRAGVEDEFVDRWEEFLTWTRAEVPGLTRAHLLRDENDPRRFLSYSRWESPDAREQWQSHPDFGEKLEACRELCDEFTPSMLSVERTV